MLVVYSEIVIIPPQNVKPNNICSLSKAVPSSSGKLWARAQPEEHCPLFPGQEAGGQRRQTNDERKVIRQNLVKNTLNRN